MIICSLLRLIKHTERLLEEKEDKLCIKVLQTLKEMMTVDIDYGEKVQRTLLTPKPIVSLLSISFLHIYTSKESHQVCKIAC